MERTDEALWRRTIPSPFPYSIPEDKVDSSLKEELSNPEKHGSAILFWAVQGLINYLNDNRLRKLPEEIIRSKDEIYSEQDPLIQFIEEECEFDEKFWTSGMALRKAYADWIALKKPMSDISFYKQLLTGRPMIQKKKGRVNNHVVGGFNGIRLIDEPFQTDIGF